MRKGDNVCADANIERLDYDRWMHLSRRQLLLSASGIPYYLSAKSKSADLDAVLRNGRQRHGVPAVVAAVANAKAITYNGAFGTRDSASGKAVQNDSIFTIASMTKAVTSAAAMQLIEQGKLSLDDAIGKHLPEFSKLQVLDGVDATTGQHRLRPATRTVTVRHLLTHTSGFVYDNWDADLARFYSKTPQRPSVPPLAFEPGERWEYGTGIDWVGRIVEVVSGMNLEAYFQKFVLQPLGMKDTSYLLNSEAFQRKVSLWRRQKDGKLKEDPYTLPQPVKSFNGGGGLYSTAPDYVRFMQMFLNKGMAPSGVRILQESSVAAMSANQVGGLAAGRLQSTRSENSSDVDFHPGAIDKFTFGFLMNPQAYSKGRSAGTLAWAGIQNTFYWIDPKKSICAVVLMQFYPFCDKEAMGLLREFEQAVYA
jgi:methyl acetate hydrolase